MLSLNSVLFTLMLLVAAIASTWAWYQWSPQVIQLNVPVGGALEAAAVAAAVGAAEPAAVGAAVAAGVGVAAVEQAATMPPTPTAALAAPATLRNCRLLYSRM